MTLQANQIITILFELIIGGIFLYGVYLFLDILKLPEQIKTIVMLFIAVVALVFLAGLFGLRVG